MGPKVGFFGGTFDPFHLGHLNFVIEMLEKSDLDEIWICPTVLSPFKEKEPPINIKHRMEMIKLAISHMSNLKLIDVEAQNKEVTYTYNTLVELRKNSQNLTLILSDDLLYSLDKWYQAEELVQSFPLLVGKRMHIALDEKSVAPFVLNQIKNKIIPIRLIDVSSSEVRMRLKNKLYCDHLLPLKILDYIHKNKLYS